MWSVFAGLALCYPAAAESLVEPSYTHDPRTATPWYIPVSPEKRDKDLAFIAGMRPHHAGALTMSEEYLSNSQASNSMLKQLAKGIIHNQKFEISMLDRVGSYLKELDFSAGSSSMKQVAAKGLSLEQRFFRAPMPGFLDWFAGDDKTSVADVKFAKAMIVHHEAALVMCQDYLDNPDAHNGYLSRMCLDIAVDQAQEIAFMHEQMNKYDGDVAQVAVDPSMIHGMDHMTHNMSKHH